MRRVTYHCGKVGCDRHTHAHTHTHKEEEESGTGRRGLQNLDVRGEEAEAHDWRREKDTKGQRKKHKKRNFTRMSC